MSTTQEVTHPNIDLTQAHLTLKFLYELVQYTF